MAEQQAATYPDALVVSVFAVLPSGLQVTSENYDVVGICSYAPDEPISAMLSAAAMLPNVTFAFTGTAPVAVRSGAPDNVRFTGWVDEAEYRALVAGAGVALGLTVLEATMQNALIEALSLGVPMVTTDTRALRQFADRVDGVKLVAPQPEAIAAAIQGVLDDLGDWQRRAVRGRELLRICAEQELDSLRSALNLDQLAGK